MFDTSMFPDRPDSGLLRAGDYAAAFESRDMLVSGIAHLLAFIQANWLGPPLELASPADFSLQDLASSGEAPYKLARHLFLLAKAKELLTPTDDFIADWWHLRCTFVHQKLFEGPLSAIKEPIFAVIARHNDRLQWTHLLEASLVCAYYEQEDEALKFLERASRSLAFEYELGGALGRRLKHQTFDVSQLVVQTNEDATSREAQGGHRTVELEDEDIIESPEFQSYVAKPAHAAVLLVHAGILAKSGANDEAQRSRLLAFANKCLECKEWSLHSTALYMRSIAESAKPRYVERAALQLQALSDQITNRHIDGAASERQLYFFQVPLPPAWELDRIQGRLFAGLGIFRTALSIFERIQAWDDVVACLVQLGEDAQAEELILKLLKEPSTDHGKLCCILGDLRNDASLYRLAWNEFRSARAKRALGRIAFKEQAWTEAIDHLGTALSINSLFANSWFLLGCAYVQGSSWDSAASAFNHVIGLDAHNADAWNNLAICHRSAGRPQESLHAFQQAARCKWDDWQVWENVATTAIEAEELQIALQACERILDIRGHEKEHLTLMLDLARRVISRGNDQLRPRVQELLSKMESSFSSSYQYWALLSEWSDIIEDRATAIEALWKQYRLLKAQPFDRREDIFASLVRVVGRLKEESAAMPDGLVAGLVDRCRESMQHTESFGRLLCLQ